MSESPCSPKAVVTYYYMGGGAVQMLIFGLSGSVEDHREEWPHLQRREDVSYIEVKRCHENGTFDSRVMEF